MRRAVETSLASKAATSSVAAASDATSSTSPGPSSKRTAHDDDAASFFEGAAAVVPRADASQSTSMPTPPLSAISRSVVTRPPSETSCPAKTLGPSASSSPTRRACCTTSKARAVAATSASATASPTRPRTWNSAVPPSVVGLDDGLALGRTARSTKTSVESRRLRSGVATLVMSGHGAYAVSVSAPGALTVRPAPSGAAMLSESLPPSIATWATHSASARAAHARRILAPSPGSLAAHIQFADSRTCRRLVTLAKHRFVSISAVARRAIAAGSSAEHCGASPTAVATPSSEKADRASTAQSATASWNGPQHCCRATRPVTERSTLCTRNRLEPTCGKARTRRSADRNSVVSGRIAA
mmetsp:Transcript_630/g.2492  ORF Transcript_630/g.2492 Transcript_630/m.2492 type:complete len:357 (+) Transcript_630:2363-3433(+)